MLEKADLSLKLDKKTFKSQIKQLEEKLSLLQQQIIKSNIPVTIIFEGWSSSGKGTLIRKLLGPLDPRFFNVYSMNRITEESYMRPYIWSFFTKTPLKGRITILDKSWHSALFPEEMKKWRFGKREKDNYYQDINAFEEQLANDGNVVIKFFLHVSQKEQRKRFEELIDSSDTRWRINKSDIEQNKNYDKYMAMFEDMISNTNDGAFKWQIIEADNYYYATVKMYKTLINILEEKINESMLKAKEKDKEKAKEVKTHGLENSRTSVLSLVNTNVTISDEEYKLKLAKYQKKINELVYRLYTKRKSVVIVYEGWDAAGKGGNIKRLTEAMDPRGYEVNPVAAPTKEELNHHYLWRFWNKFPKDGHVAVFDRSWYGRVMVERIEHFCTEEEWRRAFKEINDMERQFYNHGTIVFKFWLHIDKDEQLRRFKGRQENPAKQYKITDEDWRNREKWDLYEQAVNELLLRTDTIYAPWTIVESNSKKYARIKVLEHVVKVLEKNL